MVRNKHQNNDKFDRVLLANKFKINESNKCVYSKFNSKKDVIICLYVDDILIFGTDLEQVENIKMFLSENFDIKDMGVADVILEIKIIRYNDFIILSQSHNIKKVLKKFGKS